MYKLFGIPNCDTVKKARTYFEKKSIEYSFNDFKKNPPTKDDLLRWSKFVGDLPVNTKGSTYKKHKEQFDELNSQEKLTFIIENPSMIKRPIVEKNGKVMTLGFDEAFYKEHF